MQKIYKPWLVTNEIPQEVKDAACEEALALLSLDLKKHERIISGINSVKIGDASESYSESAIAKVREGEELLSAVAKQLLSKYRVKAVQIL